MDSNESPFSSPPIKTEISPKSKGRKRAHQDHRPKKRTLVRWSDDLDKEVLLTLQWACTESGIKIPWSLVAEQIGKGVSEGALVQHLAKLRQKMVEAKMDVPPQLRRGVVTKEPSKIYAIGIKNKTSGPLNASSTKSPAVKETPKSKTKGRSKKRALYDDDSDDVDNVDYLEDDSDEDYGASIAKKKAGSSKKKAKPISKVGKIESEKQGITVNAGPTLQEMNQDFQQSIEGLSRNGPEDGPPATRTRNLKKDFREMADLSEEEVEEEEDAGDLEIVTRRTPESTIGIVAQSIISPRTPLSPNNSVAPVKREIRASPVGLGPPAGHAARPEVTESPLLHRGRVGSNGIFDSGFTLDQDFNRPANRAQGYQIMTNNVNDVLTSSRHSGSFSAPSSRTGSTTSMNPPMIVSNLHPAYDQMYMHNMSNSTTMGAIQGFQAPVASMVAENTMPMLSSGFNNIHMMHPQMSLNMLHGSILADPPVDNDMFGDPSTTSFNDFVHGDDFIGDLSSPFFDGAM